jgi:hypothetical protein
MEKYRGIKKKHEMSHRINLFYKSFTKRIEYRWKKHVTITSCPMLQKEKSEIATAHLAIPDVIINSLPCANRNGERCPAIQGQGRILTNQVFCTLVYYYPRTGQLSKVRAKNSAFRK